MGRQPCPDIHTGWSAPVSRHRAQEKGQGSTLKQEVNWWKTWASSACTEVSGNCHSLSATAQRKEWNRLIISTKVLIWNHHSQMHTCTLKIFLQITWSLHERNFMNSFEMHPDHFWGKTDLLEAGWGCTVQTSKPGGKLPARSRWSITQYKVN